jgi:hypothetical protein
MSPAPAPVAAVAESLTLLFEDETADTFSSRVSAPNPFTVPVAQLVALMVEGKSLTPDGKLAVKSFTAPEAEVGKLSKQLSNAGAAAGITIRQKRESVGKGRVKVSFTASPKISRPRAPKVAPPETEATPEG